MIPILIPLAILTWYLTKESKEEIKVEKEKSLETIICPAGLCDFDPKQNLEGTCLGCGICFSKKDYLKESNDKVYTIIDSEEELQSFVVTCPVIINTNGEVEYKEFELEPKTLDGLTTFGIVIHFSQLFNVYDGLSLDEGGYSKLFVDYWKLVGMNQAEAEELVYGQGKYPTNYNSLIKEFWTKI